MTDEPTGIPTIVHERDALRVRVYRLEVDLANAMSALRQARATLAAVRAAERHLDAAMTRMDGILAEAERR